MNTKKRFHYEYPRPALAVDGVVLGFDEGDLKVLLIQRKLAPYKNRWALPGGFVREKESLDQAVRRELSEETGLTRVYLEQLYTFGDPGRDPREHVVSVAYYALVTLGHYKIQADTDARQVAWFSVEDPPALAFDHARILALAVQRLQGKIRYEPIGFELLPTKFTLSQLQHLYEVCLQQPLDKRNFRKKILATGLLKQTREHEQGVAHRAARLYRFDEKKYRQLKKAGFSFWI